MTAAGCLMLGVFPLLSATYSGITRHKYLSMLLLTALTLVLFVEEKIREGKTGASRGKTRALIFPSVILGSLWFLWILLSCFFGTMADALNSSGQRAVFFGAVRYEGLISQSCYFLLFLLFALSKADVEKIIRFSAASLLVFSGIVVLQYLGQNPLDLYPKGRSMRSNYEFQGTIGNIDLVNGYLCLMIPLCLGLCLMKGARGNVLLLLAGFSGMVLECLMEVQSGQMAMLLYMAALLVAALMRPALRKRCFLQLSLFCLALTLRHLLYLPWLDDPMFRQQVTEAAELGQVYTSEAPAFGFHMKALPYIAACFAFAALAVVSHLHPGRAVRARWILGSGALLALAGFLLLWLYPWGEGSGAVWELHEILSGRGQDSFGSWRWGVWRHTLEMSGKSPLFGTGPDTFLYAMQAHLLETGAVLGENFDNPHNLYLGMLSQSGIPALLFYLGMIASTLWGLIRRGARNMQGHPECVCLTLALCLYFFQGLFCFSLCITSPMVFTVLGLGAGAADKFQSQGTRPSKGL